MAGFVPAKRSVSLSMKNFTAGTMVGKRFRE